MVSSKVVVMDLKKPFQAECIVLPLSTVLCLWAVQVHFLFQAEDSLLWLLLIGRHIAKVEEERKGIL